MLFKKYKQLDVTPLRFMRYEMKALFTFLFFVGISTPLLANECSIYCPTDNSSCSISSENHCFCGCISTNSPQAYCACDRGPNDEFSRKRDAVPTEVISEIR